MTNAKVTNSHLQRSAYVYVRQSSFQQVLKNKESRARQYDFKTRALELGWRPEQVTIIDEDLAQSAVTSTQRSGFQRLVADVGLGKVGVILGLEVSRLARNCSDWYRLLEICGPTATLVGDEDGIYDPNCFNDRLLLGLKGTMSEAEIFILRARLDGGKLNKAQRGELALQLPAGLVYDRDGRVQLDPDRQVHDTMRHVFESFRRVGSALGVVRSSGSPGCDFPSGFSAGPPRETSCGSSRRWRDVSTCFETRDTQGPSSMGAPVTGEVCQRNTGCLRSSGRFLSLTPIQVSSVGTTSWQTEQSSLRIRSSTARRANDFRQGKARPFSKGSSFVVSAVGG